MDSTPVSTGFLLTALTAVVLLEVAGGVAGARLHVPQFSLIAAVRALQAMAVTALAVVRFGGPQTIGLDKARYWSGTRRGMVWSAGFAAAAGAMLLILSLVGTAPLAMLHTPLPETPGRQVLFFVVGGIVAPVAEEIVFRGLIFGYLRRWGVPAAILISTALFAALHLPAVPITQIVGGVVFALAYHHSGSLMAPITIHVLGNLAIFTLSLPVVQALAVTTG